VTGGGAPVGRHGERAVCGDAGAGLRDLRGSRLDWGGAGGEGQGRGARGMGRGEFLLGRDWDPGVEVCAGRAGGRV